jgi:hypothetical protein
MMSLKKINPVNQTELVSEVGVMFDQLQCVTHALRILFPYLVHRFYLAVLFSDIPVEQ